MATGLLYGALAAIFFVVGERLLGRLGVLKPVIFLALGIAAGALERLAPVPEYTELAAPVSAAALIFVLFFGGFGINWEMARPVVGRAVRLSVGGVLLTAGLVGVFCHLVLGFGWTEGLLLGAVLGSTDAASVFSALRRRRLRIKENTASLLEVESGSNDPVAQLLALLVLGVMGGEGPQALLRLTLLQLAVGAAVGLLAGACALWVLRRAPLSDRGMDAVFVTAAAVASYALALRLGGNSYLSVYLTGLMLGNSPIGNKAHLVRTFDGLNQLAEVVLFFALGLLVVPAQLVRALPVALAVAAFLMLVARPAAVFAILAPSHCSVRQMLLVSWLGLRGAVSIVLAVTVLALRPELEQDLFSMVVCVTALSLLIQGMLLPRVARRLHMVDEGENPLRTFNDYRGGAQVELIQMTITPAHLFAGRRIKDLCLAGDTLVVLVLRDGKAMIPRGRTEILPGDRLVISGRSFEDPNQAPLHEMLVGEKHKWAGKLLREVEMTEEMLVMLIKRGDGSTVVPHGDTKIKAGDLLVVSGGQDWLKQRREGK